jgi:hypothetical protein
VLRVRRAWARPPTPGNAWRRWSAMFSLPSVPVEGSAHHFLAYPTSQPWRSPADRPLFGRGGGFRDDDGLSLRSALIMERQSRDPARLHAGGYDEQPVALGRTTNRSRPSIGSVIGRGRSACSERHTSHQLQVPVSTCRARTGPVRRSPRSSGPWRSSRRCPRGSDVDRRSPVP